MAKKCIDELTPLKPEKNSKVHLFFYSFIELSKSRNDLFYLLGIGLMDTLGALTVVSGLSIYFTAVHGLSDVTTGCIIAMYGGGSFIYSIVLGSCIDKYGLRMSLICGTISAMLGCIVLVVTTNAIIQIFSILILISGGNSVVFPSIKLGVKYYVNEQAKSLGYSMLYILIFAGGAVAGIIVDLALTFGKKDFYTFKLLFTIATGFLIFAVWLSFLVVDIGPSENDKKSWEITKEVLKMKSFWRFMVLTMLLVVVKSLYSHLNITLPLFMNRDIEEGAHFGYVLAVHKGVMIFFIPALTSMVYFYNSYSLLMTGCFISALSVIPLLFESSYVSVVFFIVVLSVGESLYAPRLIDYTLSIAPKGKEGTFLALASSPMSLSVIVSGLMGGLLLSEFCPSEGNRHCWAMWGIIGLLTLSMPLLMLVFRESLEQEPIKENE